MIFNHLFPLLYRNHIATEERVGIFLEYARDGKEDEIRAALSTTPLLLNAGDKVDKKTKMDIVWKTEGTACISWSCVCVGWYASKTGIGMVHHLFPNC